MLIETRLERDFLENRLSKLKKRTYNQFTWWRRYQNRESLHDRRTLHDKIANGDYDHSDYYYQAFHENYLLEDAIGSIKHFEDKLDKISLSRARYKKLMDDYEKDEIEIMKNFKKDCWREFKLSGDDVENMMLEFDGTLMEFYNHLVQQRQNKINESSKNS
jgi:hypothetical protein